MNPILHFFDTLLFPFKILISSVFDLCYRMTGNYGASLLLVSFFITAVTAPLYLLADKWKNDEKGVQRRMAADIGSIKKHYSGRKRFYLTQTAYRIHQYHSWYAFRTSLGILIQIPFFFAAYDVLSQYKGYVGVSWLFLHDLAKPDGLLMGVNVLPFVMTLINVLCAVYYSRTWSVRANGQLLVMAGVFLVLLYNSPSALLVYWTMNNVFSFIKAIILRITGLQQPPVRDETPHGEDSGFRKVLRDEPALSVLFFHALCFSLSVFWIVRYDESFKYCMFASLLAALLSTALLLIRRRSRSPLVALAILWAALLPLLFFFYTSRKYNPYISNPNLKLLIVFVLDLIIFAPPYSRSRPRAETQGITSFRKAIPLVACPFFYILAYQPLSWYLSSPADTGVTPQRLLMTLFVVWAIPSAIFLALWKALPGRAKHAVPRIALFAALMALVYSLALKVHTGMLDGFTFQFPDSIAGIGLIGYLADAFVLAFLWYLAGYIVGKKADTAVLVSLVLCACLFGYSAFRFLSMDRKVFARMAETSDAMPESAYRDHRFSSDGKNIVFVIADMFNGNYIGRLQERDPGYGAKLDGFVWYPDSLSASYNTATSLPSLLGGYPYAPADMADNGKTGMQELRAAASGFFAAVKAGGYRATVANPLYFTGDDTSGAAIQDIYRYANVWKSRNGYATGGDSGGNSALLVLLSVFNSAPYHWKYILYDDANWIVYRKSGMFKKMRDRAIGEMSYISLLPDISSAAPGQSHFFYVHNELPHTPYGIGADGNPVRDGFPDPAQRNFTNGAAAYLSAKKEIDLLLGWFDWMKRNGVYDNTMIVIVSDHGNPFNDNGVAAGPGVSSVFANYDLSRSNTLLLVKDFGARGRLRTDTAFVCGADVPSLLRSRAALPIPGASECFPSARAERRFSSITSDWEDYLDRDTVKFRTYTVRGSIFSKDAWSMSHE